MLATGSKKLDNVLFPISPVSIYWVQMSITPVHPGVAPSPPKKKTTSESQDSKSGSRDSRDNESTANASHTRSSGAQDSRGAILLVKQVYGNGYRQTYADLDEPTVVCGTAVGVTSLSGEERPGQLVS